MKELRNYGDEVAREITSRGGVEGSLSQERFFDDLMKLVGNVFLRVKVGMFPPSSLVGRPVQRRSS